MEVERYSHVMHISSTVTGKLRADWTAWDALRAALPVGTVSGAPKVPKNKTSQKPYKKCRCKLLHAGDHFCSWCSGQPAMKQSTVR